MKHYNDVLFIGGPAANEWRNFTLESEASPWVVIAEIPRMNLANLNSEEPIAHTLTQHRYRIIQFPIGDRYLTVALHSDIYEHSYDKLNSAVLHAVLQRDVAKIILGE